MKSTGTVRKLDELGRIVIPMGLRRDLDIQTKDSIEIFVDVDRIILRKYTKNTACSLTNEVTERNKTFIDGDLILSPKGAEILVNEIESKFSTNI